MTDERNCGTCQHWERPPGRPAGECFRVHEHDQVQALLDGPSLIGVALWTLPSFSCSLWEAKP